MIADHCIYVCHAIGKIDQWTGWRRERSSSRAEVANRHNDRDLLFTQLNGAFIHFFK